MRPKVRQDKTMKVLIVIPTINEKDNIIELLPCILRLREYFDVLIVDDNSSDGTVEAVDAMGKEYPSRVFALRRTGKPGLGKAYIDGFKWALGKDYDFIMEMDADFSHDPKYLPIFLEKMGDSDVLLGSRYYKGRIGVVNCDIKRLLLSLLANSYAKFVTGVPISDATTGFKCFKRKVLEAIDLDSIMSEGYSFQIEMNWRARKKGFKVGEMPIVFYERKYGQSKMSGSIIREGLWVLWKMRIKP